MNKIRYINFDPTNHQLSIGFDTARDAENFLNSQSASVEWQAQWIIERVFAYGDFHYAARINKWVNLNFGQYET